MKLACHYCRVPLADEHNQRIGICDDCGERLREQADEEECERRHEEESHRPGVVLMPNWNEDDIPF